MQYIVLDMEWNQPWPGSYAAQKVLPVQIHGEIIQIGAVRLLETGKIADEFQVLVRPKYYKKLNSRVSKLTGLRDARLREEGLSFPEALERFRDWIGGPCIFLTWGFDDITVLEDNILLHDGEPDWITQWYNAQMIFNAQTGCGNTQKALSTAMELLGIEQADANGDKVDMTTSTAAITNSTAVMMTSVAGDPNAIGYISLGSLDDTVKAVSIDGVAPSAAAVKDGSYAIARPFNVVTKGDLSAPAADFFAFIMSADGQAVVSDNNYIAIDDAAAPFASNGASGKVVVAGSSSVTPVMEKLAEAFQAANPQVTVEVQQSDSTTGVNMAVDGTCDIGMASRELKDSETGAGVQSTAIALDGIAVIVAPQSSVDKLTSQQVCDIYTGAVTNWADPINNNPPCQMPQNRA